FSYDKLAWINGVYLRNAPDETLAGWIQPFLARAGLEADRATLLAILPHIRERMQTSLLDAVPLVEFLFTDPPIAADLFKGIGLAHEDPAKVLEATRTAFAAAPAFDPQALEGAVEAVRQALGTPKKPLMMTIRLAATGRKVTPPLFESIAVLGRARTLAR